MANKINAIGLSGMTAFPIETKGNASTLPVYGSAIDLPYAVDISLEPEITEAEFYADNSLQFEVNKLTKYTGTITFGSMPEKFYTDILGWAKGANGELVETIHNVKKEFALTFEIATDDKAVRVQLYKVSVKPASTSIATQSDSIEPQTIQFEFTALPRSKDGAVRVKMVEPDAGAEEAISTKWDSFKTTVVEST